MGRKKKKVKSSAISACKSVEIKNEKLKIHSEYFFMLPRYRVNKQLINTFILFLGPKAMVLVSFKELNCSLS